MVQEEDKQNVELINLSKQILELTEEVRGLAAGKDPPRPTRARRE
jgi:hypothetical protein